MKRIRKFGVYQTAKVVAILYFLITAVFMIPFGLMASIFGDNFAGFPFSGGLIYILAPFLYGIIAFFITTIGCLIYNLTVKWIGGIEVDIETID